MSFTSLYLYYFLSYNIKQERYGGGSSYIGYIGETDTKAVITGDPMRSHQFTRKLSGLQGL